MKIGSILAVSLTVIGLCAVVFAFVSNASPYVTVAEAKTMSGDNLHLAGDLDKSTLQIKAGAQQVHFILVDETGTRMPVVYDGPPPANMGEATKVVAVGSVEGDAFMAHKLLLKCPSKYESEPGASRA